MRLRKAGSIDGAVDFGAHSYNIRDYKTATKWWSKAANAGNAKAMYDLGFCYYYAQGVVENQRYAYTLMLKSKAAGDPSAAQFVENLRNETAARQAEAAMAIGSFIGQFFEQAASGYSLPDGSGGVTAGGQKWYAVPPGISRH